MNNNIDIGEIICESVDTIVTERLRTVNFDATITCTIVDDGQKEQGTYIVTDGSTRFTAYTTDTKLKNNQQVYVTIPNNDYSEQKMIIGKKTTDNANQPYMYTPPFNNFIKGSDNLAITSSDDYYGLTANSDYKDDQNIEKQPVTIMTIPVIDILPTTEIPFTRIGIKANFKTLLPSNTTQGNYGLRIVPKTNNNESEPAALDCNDFYGNPYQFFNYINQEQVFVIPPTWKQITEISLQFFQDNNFNLDQPEEIDEDLSWIEDSMGESITNDNNIFVSGIELYLGYDVNDFDKDNFQIYSIDNNYNYSNINGIQTEKILKGEWVFIGKDGENSEIISADALPYDKEIYNPLKKNILLSNDKYINMYCWEKGKNSADRMVYQGVRWYRQKYGASRPDEYAGSGWEILDPANKENGLYYFNSPLELKVFLRTNNAEETYKCIVFDDIIFTQPELENKESIENIEIYENIEQVEKPLQINSCIPIISNTINFINSTYEKTTSINKQTQLAIITTDNEDGSYYYYNLLGDIENTNWSSASRTLELYYESAQLNQNSKCKVMWTIPVMHTMFQAASFKILGMNLDEINTSDKKNWINVQNLNQQKNPTASTDIFYKRITIDNLNGEAIGLLNNPFILTYQISQKYNQKKINNNIDCKLYYLNDEIPYTTSRRFNFGISNTSGTEVAFQLQCVELDVSNNTIGYQPIIKLNQEIQRFQIIPRIIIGKIGQQLDPTAFDIEYSWYKRKKDIPICVNKDYSKKQEDNSYILQIDKKEDVDLEDYLVLQATMSYGEYQNLTAYLSFAFSGEVKDDEYAEIPEGTFEIIYDSASGLPFKNYEISYKIDNTIEEKVSWGIYKMSLETGEEKQNPIDIHKNGQDPYYPIITSMQNNLNVLTPSSFYSEELEPISVRALGSEEELYWSQPLLILKNRFPNSIINKWQENLFIDKENNTILSAMMVAGSKDDYNRFSGVIMGDIKGESDSPLSQHGLYGYESGYQVFGFKGDGTAFLGKNGRGQIIFDGSQGIIKSGYQKEDENLYTGIKIDLDGEDQKSPYINLQSTSVIMNGMEQPEKQIAFQTELKPEGLFIKRGKIQLASTLPNDTNLIYTLPEATLLDIDEEKVKIPQLLVKENLGVSGSRITNTKILNTETNVNTLIDYALEVNKYTIYLSDIEALINDIHHCYIDYPNFMKKEIKSNNIVIYGFNGQGLREAKNYTILDEFVGRMRSVYKGLYEYTEEWGPDNLDPDPSNILRSWVDLSQMQNYTFIEKYYDNLSTCIKNIYVFRDLFKFRKYYDGEVEIDQLVFNEDLTSPQNDDLVFCPLPADRIRLNKIFNLSLIPQVGNIWRPNLIEKKE